MQSTPPWEIKIEAHESIENLNGEVVGALTMVKRYKEDRLEFLAGFKLFPIVGEEHAPFSAKVCHYSPRLLASARLLQKRVARIFRNNDPSELVRKL
jgi:hypothetical protein